MRDLLLLASLGKLLILRGDLLACCFLAGGSIGFLPGGDLRDFVDALAADACKVDFRLPELFGIRQRRRGGCILRLRDSIVCVDQLFRLLCRGEDLRQPEVDILPDCFPGILADLLHGIGQQRGLFRSARGIVGHADEYLGSHGSQRDESTRNRAAGTEYPEELRGLLCHRGQSGCAARDLNGEILHLETGGLGDLSRAARALGGGHPACFRVLSRGGEIVHRLRRLGRAGRVGAGVDVDVDLAGCHGSGGCEAAGD